MSTLAPPSRSSPAAKIALVLSTLVLIALAYWVGVYGNMSERVKAARKRGADLRAELTRAQQDQASYVADRDELALCQQRAREQARLLPTDAQEASFLSTVQQAANTSGIDLKGWSPLQEQPQSFYAKVPMRLEIRGRFHQIAKFTWELARPEADRRIINVENIELTDPRVSGDDVVLSGKCLATAFHTLSPAASGAPAPAPTAVGGGP